MRVGQSLFVSTPFFQMSQIPILLSALLAALLLPGCGRDNGMSRELIDHLKAHGVVIQPSRVEAPLSQRGGFLVAQYDASAVAKIISEFGLQRMALDDPRWVFIAQKVSSTVAAKEVWGVSGRPLNSS